MNFTPIEQRIIDILSDGMPHSRAELLKCVNDTENRNSTALVTVKTDYHGLAVHIYNMRRKVRPFGQEIVYELRRGGYHYRHISLLSGKDPGGADPL